MKNSIFFIIALAGILVTGCRTEDYGPRQSDVRTFNVTGFDRLEAGDAFDINVVQGSVFSIQAAGDRRDLDDLAVTKIGSTLNLKYSVHEKRQYTVYFTITMPAIQGLDLSGAVNARVTGFDSPSERFDVSLSGASVGQFQVISDEVHVLITGSSSGYFTGTGSTIDASVSGASELAASGYPVDQAELIVTGASKANVSVSDVLTVSASGASEVVYHGNPQVDSDASGQSTIRQEN